MGWVPSNDHGNAEGQRRLLGLYTLSIVAVLGKKNPTPSEERWGGGREMGVAEERWKWRRIDGSGGGEMGVAEERWEWRRRRR